jgi:hypothetical protein
MKNLTPYKEDCYSVHKKAVDKKQAGDLKERLLKINPLVEKEYINFIENFNKNSLILVKPNLELNKSKEDLQSLYKYQSRVIRDVRESIRGLQIKTIISTCQNCTLDSINTLDHILPQATYPEFVVNPKNLFPCCSTCNSYKLDAISTDSDQKFLNLYLDKLPDVQYLFVDISLDTFDDIDFNYYLKNVGNSINESLFKIIENHYTKLHLFERFKLKSIEYISELESRISAFRKRLTIQEIVSDLTQAIQDEKKAYGYNHWKCILELSLINNDLFMNRFKDT